MRDAFFPLWALPPRPGRDNLDRFEGLTKVGKSAGHHLASPADFPTEVSWSATGAYRLPGRFS